MESLILFFIMVSIIAIVIFEISRMYKKNQQDSLNEEVERSKLDERKQYAKSIEEGFQYLGWEHWNAAVHLMAGQLAQIKSALESNDMVLTNYDPDTGVAYVRIVVGYHHDGLIKFRTGRRRGCWACFAACPPGPASV